MRPTETLAKEHELVLRVTKAAEQEVRYMHDTGEYRQEAVEELVDFFEFFTEASHDPKEERLLFARLCQRGLSRDSGILAQFYREHQEFTSRLKTIAHWLRAAQVDENKDVKELAEQLQDYLQLMRSHVAREEDLLFTLADGLLTDQDQEELEQAFASASQEEADIGVQDRWSELAHLVIGRPTETLQKEHKVCYPVLDAAEREIKSMKEKGYFDAEVVDQLIDFFRYYTRECHEPKEAQLLFSKLAERGMSREEGLLAEMIQDHVELGERMDALSRHFAEARAHEGKGAASLLHEMEGYVKHMRGHMEKEEAALFPVVNHVLRYRDLEELEVAFASFESEEIFQGVHEKYVDLARRLTVSGGGR